MAQTDKISPSELQKNIIANITAVLDEWGDELDTVLIAAIKKRKLDVTGGLLRSLKSKIATSSADKVVQELLFAKQGRTAELRSLTYSNKTPPIAGILAWLLKNKKAAKYVPGLKELRKPSSLADYKRVAGAMAYSKLKKQKKRRKAWYTKNYYELLPKLINNLLESLTEEEIKLLNNIPQEIQIN